MTVGTSELCQRSHYMQMCRSVGRTFGSVVRSERITSVSADVNATKSRSIMRMGGQQRGPGERNAEFTPRQTQPDSRRQTAECGINRKPNKRHVTLRYAQSVGVRRIQLINQSTRMWANAQRDRRPVEYRWRPLFNAAVWLTPTTTVPYSNAAKTRNPLKFAAVPQTTGPISAASGLKFTILPGHVEEILLLNKFFSDCRYVP